MESIAIIISGFGHACWDYQLTWMAQKDPDASVLHMHWLRMTFTMILLQTYIWNKPRPRMGLFWWLKFTTLGFFLPPMLYTYATLWTNYRIPVSFQGFVPLMVALKNEKKINNRLCISLTIIMLGTLCIWTNVRWKYELWELWAAILASIVQTCCLVEFFIMLNNVQGDKISIITYGIILTVGCMFSLMVIFMPQHFDTILFDKLDLWLYILIASALATGIKYGLIGYFSGKMTPDGVAVFECIHPISTLFADIVRGKDVFQLEDFGAVLCFSIGWILYPKMNI